jgi:hypothetical protein
LIAAQLAVFVFCLLGCGVHCWSLGRQEGVQGTIKYLVDNGLLEVEPEEGE